MLSEARALARAQPKHPENLAPTMPLQGVLTTTDDLRSQSKTRSSSSGFPHAVSASETFSGCFGLLAPRVARLEAALSMTGQEGEVQTGKTSLGLSTAIGVRSFQLLPLLAFRRRTRWLGRIPERMLLKEPPRVRIDLIG